MLDGAAQAVTGEDLDNPKDRSSPVIFISRDLSIPDYPEKERWSCKKNG
jgi:hypothetical protein